MINATEYKKLEDFWKENGVEVVKKNSEMLKLAKELENSLMESVRKNNFEMYYQPKVDANGQTTKSEALFRTKEEFFIRPDLAFALFKEFGHEGEVLMRQVEMVCKDAGTFKKEVSDDYCVSFNVAIAQLDESFCKKLDEHLAKNKLKYSNIEIEILENEDFENIPADKKEIINKLKEKGVKLALDDYGSGNANETAFKSLPFDTIKIDMEISFKLSDKYYEKNGITDPEVIKKEKSEAAQKIKEAYEMARKQNKKVNFVVEGVEDEKQLKKLKEIAKDVISQGYHYSKPIPPKDLVAYSNNLAAQME